jgi:hypothetical protein
VVVARRDADVRSVPVVNDTEREPEHDEPPASTPEVDPSDEPPAGSAGTEDHTDPDLFRGGEADAPRDPDEPIEDGDDS